MQNRAFCLEAPPGSLEPSTLSTSAIASRIRCARAGAASRATHTGDSVSTDGGQAGFTPSLSSLPPLLLTTNHCVL